MANQNDSFIDEVTEDLRRDRLFQLMRRYGWIVILIIVLIVGATAWREWAGTRAQTEARAFGDAILAAGEAGDSPAARAEALAAIEPAGEGQAMVRGLLAAAALAEAESTAAAAEQLDRVAATAAAESDVVNRDLARLKTVLVQGPTMDPATRDAVLAELSVSGAPFELLALELKAVALIGAGLDQDAAVLIRQIQQKEGVSQAMRRRLSEMLIMLGSDTESSRGDNAPDPTRAAEMVPAEIRQGS